MSDPAEQIQKSLRWLVRTTIALYLILAGMFAVGFTVAANQRADLKHEIERNTTALCALRADLVNRVAAGRQFLEDHPDGLDGLSAANIQQSIDSQNSAITALSSIDCG